MKLAIYGQIKIAATTKKAATNKERENNIKVL
jgi:hypothetical protein